MYSLNCIAFNIRQQNFRVSYLFCGILVFVLYYSLRLLLSPFVASWIQLISLAAFVGMFLFFMAMPDLLKRVLNWVIISLSLFEAIYGLFLFYENDWFTLHGIAGHFDNPAGFAMCVACGLPFCWEGLYSGNLLEKTCAWVSLGIIIIAIVCSQSRTAMIAAGAISAGYCFAQFKVFGRVRLSKKQLAFGMILTGGIITGLFLLKQESAIGRIFIWKNTLSLACDNVLFGSHPGAFLSAYMHRQAAYFSEMPNSKYSFLADNVAHPFNEYLCLFAETGIIGIILLGGILWVLLRAKQNSPYVWLVVCVGICACFSYPMKYPFIAVVLAYSLAQIEMQGLELTKFPLHGWVVRIGEIIVMVVIAVASIVLVNDIGFELQWNRLINHTMVDEDALQAYHVVSIPRQ